MKTTKSGEIIIMPIITVCGGASVAVAVGGNKCNKMPNSNNNNIIGRVLF